MPTDKQIAANRANSRKSSGPVTPTGKLAASQNSLKSGIYAKSLVIRGEDPADLETLTAEFVATYQPRAADERALVDTLIANEWTLRRLRKSAPQIWDSCLADIQDLRSFNPEFALGHVVSARQNTLTTLQRLITAAERAFHRALMDLQRLQKSRPTAAPPAQPVQPAEPETTSPKLASFPQNSAPPSDRPYPLAQTTHTQVEPASEASPLTPDA